MHVQTDVGQLTDKQMAEFADFIYSITGIRIPLRKKTMLSNRIRRRLRQTNLAGYDEYFHHLNSCDVSDPEWDAFLQEVSTHETYMFRDQSHWNWLKDEFLCDLVEQARQGRRPRTLRVWSAASSTGEEAHTVAMCIAATVPNIDQWDIQVLGTDIGIGAIEQAQRGVFGPRSVKLVPDEWRRRYFRETKPGKQWQAKPQISKMLRFRQHNLLDPLVEQPFNLVIMKKRPDLF